MFGRRPQAEAPAPPGSPPPAPRPAAPPAAPPPPPPPRAGAAAPARAAAAADAGNQAANEKRAAAAKAVFGRIQMGLLERIDASAAAKLSRDELQRQIAELIGEIVAEEKLSVTSREQQELTVTLVDDMVGFGPLEPLLARRVDQRHHGQRPAAGLRRAQGQARADRHPLPRQRRT